jgi:hypothetical protein
MAFRILLQTVQPIINFTQLVIIEPMVSAKGPSHLRQLRDGLLTKAVQRTDVWPTLDAARQAAAKRKWHPKVIDVFVVCLETFLLVAQARKPKFLETCDLLESRD